MCGPFPRQYTYIFISVCMLVSFMALICSQQALIIIQTVHNIRHNIHEENKDTFVSSLKETRIKYF